MSGGRATGVQLVGGETVTATRAVIASVTPTQLYGKLLGPGWRRSRPPRLAEAFRYGRAGMQIHFALSEPPVWASSEASRLSRTAIVHVTPGLDGVSRAVNEAERGLLPAEATIVVGQPCAVDPGRAPDGSWILWIQLQELPRVPRGDALGHHRRGRRERGRKSSARRTPTGSPRGSRDRSATSSERRSSAWCSRRPTSRRSNCNLVGGDIYAGSCALDQNLLWRPSGRLPGHATAIDGLWQIGASTHPGPGLGPGSGYLVAKQLTRPPLHRRMVDRVPVAFGKLRERLPL